MSPMDALLDAVKWVETGSAADESGLPYATHTGVLRIFDIDIPVFQLNTGQRVIDGRAFEEMLEGLRS